MKIESADRDIRALLTSGYYRIPRFQRPYSWDAQNIHDFWNDVVGSQAKDYFIGSMVVFKAGQQEFGLVDGQQRLTTITILLCVLRNTLRQMEHNDLAEGIHSLVERRNIDNRPQWVLTTESSYPYFQDRIQREKSSSIRTNPLQEEHALREAFELLSKFVHEEVAHHSDPNDPTKALERLVAIRDAVLNLKLIFVKLEDEDDAYLIFETINTRGKDLSLKDLVKNHITKHMKTSGAPPDEANVVWEEMIQTIEESNADLDTDVFIHHFWLSRYEYLPAKTLFQSLKKKIVPPVVQDFLGNLRADASTYRAIQERGYYRWAGEERRAADALAALTIFRVQQPTPCTLSLVRAYRNKKLKIKRLQEALVAIEKFHFLTTAVASQPSSGGISAMYAALGRRLTEAASPPEAVRVIDELVKKLRERVPTEAEFVAAFPTVVYTDGMSKQKRLVKYILTLLDSQTRRPEPIDYEKMTIEHILPQSAMAKTGTPATLIGQLGNLVLVPADVNNQLEDAHFVDKKRILTSSGIRLPDSIRRARTWGKKEIESRTKELAVVAYGSAWKI